MFTPVPRKFIITTSLVVPSEVTLISNLEPQADVVKFSKDHVCNLAPSPLVVADVEPLHVYCPRFVFAKTAVNALGTPPLLKFS